MGGCAYAKLCQKGGWQSLFQSNGSGFASQGACVSYGAHGGFILTTPTTDWQATCEENGGTFSAVPFGSGGVEYDCTPVTSLPVFALLSGICADYPDAVGAGTDVQTTFCQRSGSA